MSYYPNQIAPSNPQDESNDVPGNDQIMNARDYNFLEGEVLSVEQTLGVLGSTNTSTVLGAISDIRKQLSNVLEKQTIDQKPFDFIVSPSGKGDVIRIDSALYHLPVAGGSIRLKTGNHNVGTQLEMPVGQNVMFVGEGMSTVVTIADTITGFALTRPTAISFFDMKFQAATGSSTNVAITISNGGTLYLTRCMFKDFNYDIKFTGTGGEVRITDCVMQDSLTTSLHVQVDGGIVYVNGTRITHNSNNGTGIDIIDGEVMVSTTRIDDALYGIRAIGDLDLVITCTGSTISDCTNGVFLSGTTTATIVGNTLKDNGTAIISGSTGSMVIDNNNIL